MFDTKHCMMVVVMTILATAAAAAERDVKAGPIRHGAEAKQTCPVLARKHGGAWTGKWHAYRDHHVSYCTIKLNDVEKQPLAVNSHKPKGSRGNRGR